MRFVILLLLFGLSSRLHANGLNRNGVGAKSMGRGGTAVANFDDSFAGMAVNPALLSYLDTPDLSVSAVGVVADGTYSGTGGIDGYLDENTGAFPEIVIRTPLSNGGGLGFSLIPEQARLGDWIFRDPPGGIDGSTSYGLQPHRSQILGLRAALGLGIPVTDTLSVGGSIGVLYNRNELRGPYIFQNHPVLAGFKTLVDLDTEGYGVNGDLGLTWTPHDDVTVGLAYRTPTRVKSTGKAAGDISAQFRSLGLGGLPGEFLYDATVINHFPDQLSLGTSLRISDKTTVSLEADWVRWSEAFENLEVRLRNGNNPAINSVLNSNAIDDRIPLDWNDVVVTRLGIEHRINEKWQVRAGYSYGKSPIPTSTLVPTTAAISEHTVSLGLTHKRGPCEISLAYQYDLPASAVLDNSEILSGEYRDGAIDLEAQWVALSVRYEF